MNIVLDTAKRELMHDGRWLNVIGYVRSRSASETKSTEARESAAVSPDASLPVVQAVLLWDAGAIDIKKYETILQEQMAVRTRARSILVKAHEAIDNEQHQRERQLGVGKR